jgi:hypothetical protein
MNTISDNNKFLIQYLTEAYYMLDFYSDVIKENSVDFKPDVWNYKMHKIALTLEKNITFFKRFHKKY